MTIVLVDGPLGGHRSTLAVEVCDCYSWGGALSWLPMLVLTGVPTFFKTPCAMDREQALAITTTSPSTATWLFHFLSKSWRDNSIFAIYLAWSNC